ncbi:acylphosphatase [Oleidesulfovibrio sp.]|uniref:acylphosphatase n=1 Tax=Oleidesulfovibrio sp. TaxID=2909707 RepID=UPI003A863443
MERIRCTVHGRVQGVGFRYWTQKKATSLGLSGWVKNCSDGTVQLEATGLEEQLSDLVEALNEGPLFSKVTQVDCKRLQSSGATENEFLIND